MRHGCCRRRPCLAGQARRLWRRTAPAPDAGPDAPATRCLPPVASGGRPFAPQWGGASAEGMTGGGADSCAPGRVTWRGSGAAPRRGAVCALCLPCVAAGLQARCLPPAARPTPDFDKVRRKQNSLPSLLTRPQPLLPSPSLPVHAQSQQSSSIKRIQKELKDLKRDPPAQCSAGWCQRLRALALL